MKAPGCTAANFEQINFADINQPIVAKLYCAIYNKPTNHP